MTNETKQKAEEIESTMTPAAEATAQELSRDETEQVSGGGKVTQPPPFGTGAHGPTGGTGGALF